MSIPLHPAEIILIESPANLFRGMEGVGGRIKVTNMRVLFEAHALNIQSQPEEIPLAAIAEVGKRNTMGIIPNGMFVRTKDGREFQFVTWKREKLIAAIQSQLTNNRA